MDVYTFEIKGCNVEMTFKKGYIAYTFDKDGKTYGKKIKVPSRGVMDIVAVATLLVADVYATIDAL